MQITADVSKILESNECDLIFIFNLLSESSIGFASFSAVLALRNVVSFTKMGFIDNKAVQICVTMWKYARTFIATIKSIEFSYSFSC